MHLDSAPATDAPVVPVLGPSNIDRVASAARIAPADLVDAAEKVGALLAARGWAMIVVPDRGVAVSAMDGYLAAGGTRLIGLTPASGVSEPAAMPSIERQRVRCHELRDELTWFEQHHQIGEMSDAMVTIGLSCGTIAELAWTKWNPSPPPVAFVDGTASGLPPEIAAELRVDVMPLSNIGGWLDASVAVSAGSVV